MEPSDEKTIEIARRTRKNLEYVYAQYDQGAPVYEFTQLFNSMLGILVCLREEYFHGSEIEWSDVEHLGLRVAVSLKSKSEKFSRLISCTRNAVAHSNYFFIADGNRKIIGVEIWNVPSNTSVNDRKKRAIWTWSSKFTENELRDFAYLMLNYLEKSFDLDINGEPTDPSDA